MSKQLLKALMTMVIAALFLAPMMTAGAETSGTCGNNLTWTLDDDGLLTISGTGEMEDYINAEDSTLGRYVTTAPWGGEVKAVVIEEGVTGIGYGLLWLQQPEQRQPPGERDRYWFRGLLWLQQPE